MTSVLLITFVVTCLLLLSSLVLPVYGHNSMGSITAPYSDYYDLFPRFMANILVKTRGAPQYTFSARCFKNYTASMDLDLRSKKAIISLDSQNHRALLCMDTFLILHQDGYHVRTVLTKGKHTWKISLDDMDVEDLMQNGIYLFNLHSDMTHLVGEMWHLMRLFLGQGTVKENYRFITEYLKVPLESRTSSFVLDRSRIQSGDVILQFSFTGLSTMIAFGTNAPGAGHAAMVLDIDGELHVIEATDEAPFTDEPSTPEVRRGVVATPYEQWVKYQDATTMTVIVPLSEESRRKWNNTAAVEFFRSREGNPYGHSNFLFSWIDTEDESYPPPASWPVLLSVFHLIEGMMKKELDLMLFEGVRHRLNDYSISSLKDIINLLVKRGDMNFGELLAIPERDEWKYDGTNQLICSSLVVATLKAAGVIDPSVARFVDATEFSPKDLLQLKLFSETWNDKPFGCGLGNFPACQIGTGTHWMPVDYWPFFNSVEPYPGMNTRCPRARTPEMKC